jgi:hypothetical protein
MREFGTDGLLVEKCQSSVFNDVATILQPTTGCEQIGGRGWLALAQAGFINNPSFRSEHCFHLIPVYLIPSNYLVAFYPSDNFPFLLRRRMV